MARCHFPFPVWHMLKCSSHAMPCRIVACGTSAKCPWQATSGVILPLLQPLIYYRLTAPKVGHKVDASNTWGKLTHDVRYFSSFWFEILMQYIQTYSMYYMISICVFFCRAYAVLPAAISEQQQSQQCRCKANTFAAITLSAWPQMEWALFRSDNAKEHHIAGGQIRIFGLSRQTSGQQDGEFHSKKKKIK